MRKYHTSAVTEEGLLLVGGTVEPTRTELIPLPGILHLQCQPSCNILSFCITFDRISSVEEDDGFVSKVTKETMVVKQQILS